MDARRLELGLPIYTMRKKSLEMENMKLGFKFLLITLSFLVPFSVSNPVYACPPYVAPLAEGYNPVGVAVDIYPLAAEDICEDITGGGTDVDRVIRYNSSTGMYDTHICGLPINNFELSFGEGCFIHSLIAGEWTQDGPDIESPQDICMTTGYNLIGLPRCVEDMTAEELCAAIDTAGGDVDRVIRYDTGTGMYETHICGLPMNDFVVSAGVAHFVRSNSEFCYACAQDCPTCPVVESMDAAGDSISKAVNADEGDCGTADQEWLNWATSDTHGADYCGDGGDGVYSHAEMIECFMGHDIDISFPNSAQSGALMLLDFVNQAVSIEAFLSTAPAPRYATVFLGHNDVCSGTIDKISGDQCNGNIDRNPNDYCRTTAEAFEREFRKGLDILIEIPDARIGIASLVRVSQLCNHENMQSCYIIIPLPCSTIWGLGDICSSLTSDCSDERIIDAYNTAQTYRDILQTVTAEYAAISEGDPSNIVNIGGEVVGGTTKSAGVRLVFSDLPWVYKFSGDQISCCDCFHPSIAGQDVLSMGLFEGLNCSDTDICCLETGHPLTDALCSQEDRSGTYYPGFF